MATAARHGAITDGGLAALRSRIGIPHEARRYGSRRGLFTLINQDSAHVYATASGDANPLYADAAYARASHWGAVVAPPTILFNAGTVEGRPLTAREREEGRGGGLPGVHGMFSGADWEWYRPLREGDELFRVGYVADAQEKSGVFAGRQVLTLTEHLFRNQRREVLAKMTEWSMRTERDAARERGKYDWTPHAWTDGELARIDEACARERPRGAETRWWEDVEVGDALDGIVRGPYRATDAVAWDIGWGGVFARSGKVDYDYRQRHPRAYSKNRYGIPDVPERVHWESEFAREVGVPALYDYGPQRIAWASTLLTNWMGDEGFLKRLWVQVRRFNIEGDAQWYRGEVIAKEFADGEARVVCDLWAENQRGEVTAPGQAIVLLPSREHGPVRIPASGRPAYPRWGPDEKVEPVGQAPLPRHSATHGFLLPGVQG